MEAPVQRKPVYRFGLFQVDASARKLLRKGLPVKLHEQPLRVLCLLLEHPGEVVSREELRQSLWPDGTFVEFDGSLNAALKKLRYALGDDADNPVFIETVPRRGYRFIAPVDCEPGEEASDAAAAPALLQPGPLASSGGAMVSFLRRWWIWWVLTAAAGVLFLAWPLPRKNPPTLIPARKVIAVLPFSNEGAGPDFDYLRYAIANDLVTDLTHVRSVTVRPFASTSRFASQPTDPEAVGKELRVTHVIAGGFLLDKKNLRINLELIDVAQNQPIWRDEVMASPQNLVALHDELATRAAKGLLPAINISNASAADMPAPKNEQALDLFLHAVTIPLDPEPNRHAIKTLEQSVALDGSYGRAWAELGWRYYIDYHYGNGGEAAVRKSLQAYQRSSEVDPGMPPAPVPRAEQGDLNGAYDLAAEYLRRQPDASLAHYYLSYILRYAGLLEEAGKQCDAALAIDPGFNFFRSCSNPFILQNDYAHAQIYIRLDEHSGVGALLRMMIALRTGNTANALAEAPAASQSGYKIADLARTCINRAPVAEVKQAAAAVVIDPNGFRDPEEIYRNAEVLSFCRQSDAALGELSKAIQGNYCSYPAMDKDPLFDAIRPLPEFTALRRDALECQENFLVHRQHVDAAAIH